MDSREPIFDVIENDLYNLYVKNYKKQIVWSKDPKGIVRNLDRLKMTFLTTIFPFELNKAYIQPSKIHGFGVFAKKDIQKNELITFYPGDIIEYTPNKDIALCCVFI